MTIKNYKPRVLLIFTIFLVGCLLVLIRLACMQLYFGDFYKVRARNQYHVNVKINPVRGAIVDRYGETIACNIDMPSAYLLPKLLNSPDITKQLLADSFPEAYMRYERFAGKHFMWVERMLSSEKETLLQEQQSDIKMLLEPHRYYPHPALETVLGKTDIDNRGVAGLELSLEKKLRGSCTNISLEKDARFKNLYFEKNIDKQGVQGEIVQTTIDTPLQLMIHEELERTVASFDAQEGSVLVMNPNSGEILVMANCSSKREGEQGGLLKNSIVTECYELGSVLKIFAALAALEEEVVGFDEPIDCEGKVAYINKFRVENWKSIGVEPFYNAVKRSSNVGTAKVALRLQSKLYDHLVRVGFGEKTGIQFPGERSGFVNKPRNWSRSSPIVLSFGYEIMASLLQLGVATSIIANGGYAVKPTLLQKSAVLGDKQRLYREKTIEQMGTILKLIGEHYPVKDCNVMGKTGTARVAVDGEYSRTRHVYTFAGIIEKNSIKRVIVTFLREPAKAHLWASGCVAPLFQRVAQMVVVQGLTS